MARRKNRISTLIGSLLLACIIWGYVTLAKVYENDVEVPLTVLSPPNQALLSSVPGVITVRVRGTGLQIINLKYLSEGTECKIDLANVRSQGQAAYVADRDDIIRSISMPSSLRVVSVSPEQITMSTGDLATRRVPVRLNTNLACRNGFSIMKTPVPEPDSVEIRGTKSVIESITHWSTEKLSLEDLHSSTTAAVAVSDSLMTLLNVVPSTITVKLDVQQMSEISIGPIAVVRSSADMRSIQLIPNKIRVTVRSGVDELAQLSAADFRVEIPPNAIGPVIPVVTAPPGITIVGIDPHYIRVLNKEASP